jgi:hypothetical protein
MSARNKLNGWHLFGALVTAAVLGLLSGSAAVFLVTLGGVLAADVFAGNIRPPRT